VRKVIAFGKVVASPAAAPSPPVVPAAAASLRVSATSPGVSMRNFASPPVARPRARLPNSLRSPSLDFGAAPADADD
jgi:hypothetical protein